MKSTLQELRKFKKKYPLTIAWRLEKHAEIIDKHLNAGEEVVYAFCGQKTQKNYDFISTYVVALTTERILIARRRLIAGYSLDSVMPYMFNDLNVRAGVIWGKICIDTAKEEVNIVKLDKASLDEVETAISGSMVKLKQKYKPPKKDDK
jgi:hypothetical protein